MFKNNVDAIVRTFNKAIFDLERLEQRRAAEIEAIDARISVAEASRAENVAEIERAAKIRSNLENIVA